MDPTPPPATQTACARESWFARLSKGLVISLAVLLLLAVLLETVPRWIDLPGLTRDDLMPRYLVPSNQRLEGHPYLAYRERPSWDSRIEDYKDPSKFAQVHHNSLGFRGRETTWEKPPGVFRIVCVGGSSTYGHTESADATTWPARLEHHLRAARPDLNIEVINGGASGYSTFESLINLELRLVDFQPDLVIYYEGINDVRCALYAAGSNPGDPPGPVNDNRHWRAIWPVYRASPMEQVLERSWIYLIWRAKCTDYLEKRATLGFSAIRNFDGKFYAGHEGDLAYDPYLAANPPEQGFRNFQRNLVSLVAVARAHGAKVLFGTQAMRFADLAGSPSRDSQTAAIQRMKGILRAVAAERGVPLVETAKIVEDEAARQLAEKGREDIFGSEVHLLDQGSDLLAKTFAEAIVANGLLP
jgi:lysophospholipase L1-like esterase